TCALPIFIIPSLSLGCRCILFFVSSFNSVISSLLSKIDSLYRAILSLHFFSSHKISRIKTYSFINFYGHSPIVSPFSSNLNVLTLPSLSILDLSNQGLYCNYLFFLKYSHIHSNIIVILVFRIFINKPDGNFLFPNKYQLAKLIRFYVLIWWRVI